MLNYFKKRINIKKVDFSFLKSITESLQVHYPNLSKQVNPDFILDKIVKPNNDLSFNFRLNSDLEDDFKINSSSQYYIIKNILVWNNRSNKFEPVELEIVQGMLAGYKLPDIIKNLNGNQIDVSKIFEKHFQNNDRNELIEITGDISKTIQKQLDLENTFKIEIPRLGVFYTIKNFKDGNYIAVNKKGEVYMLIHDPYKIECIYSNKNAFFNDLNSGSFNMIKYYENRMF